MVRGLDPNEDYKIWCETKQEGERVLRTLEENGIKWVSGKNATVYLTEALVEFPTRRFPIGLFLEPNVHLPFDMQKNNCCSHNLLFGEGKDYFDSNSAKELTVDTLLHLLSHNIPELTIGSLPNLLNESIF